MEQDAIYLLMTRTLERHSLPSVKSSCGSLKDMMLVVVSLLSLASAIYVTITMTSFSSLILTTCLALTLQSATCFVVAPCKSLVGSNSMEMHMMFRRNTAKASEPSSSSRGKAVQITEITKMDDFIKFLGQDDRLCVVK
jgi:hypothetical protein